MLYIIIIINIVISIALKPSVMPFIIKRVYIYIPILLLLLSNSHSFSVLIYEPYLGPYIFSVLFKFPMHIL